VAVANVAGKLTAKDVPHIVQALDVARFAGEQDRFASLLKSHAVGRAVDSLAKVLALPRYGPTLGSGVPGLYAEARKAATRWADEHAAELVVGLDETTQDGLRSLLTQAIDADWDQDVIVERLADLYGFTEDRARVIAITETSFADTQGAIIGWQQSDRAVGKQWLAQELACDRCADMDGVVEDLDAPFTTKDGLDWVDGPPLHPRCYCILAPVLGDVYEE
jgi:hypothetical protein